MPENFNFAENEKKILKFWKEQKIFEKSMEQRKKSKPFVFFEGPPTANGLPHVGHFMSRSYKDVFGRYKTMRGYYVLRRAGWDTHGLPVEIEVEKGLGLKNKKEIEEYGIAKFNKKAKESVWKYKSEWERTSERMGIWLDFDNYYATYKNSYIESVWWFLKEAWNKKLLYKGHKVLPYCTRCGTSLSSHEVAQGYKDVTEPAVYIKFKLEKKQKIKGWNIPKNTCFLAWTTTPWTLPGNVALAVGEKFKYLVVRIGDEFLILAEGRESVLKGERELVKSFAGKDLVGLRYESLFKIKSLSTKKSHRIYPADFVTTENGTGIVHTAVMYGEDDYELGKKVGLPMHHTVDLQGKFTKEVKGLAGQYVKDADKDIIETLKKGGLLYGQEPYTHSYPHCWRCKLPLIYYAKDSWFIRMSSLRKELIKRNETVNWRPEHIKEGRFGEFLHEVKDWALSRERYWGTPLPVWQCLKCKNYIAVGSIEDLEKYRPRKKNVYYILRHGHSEKNANGGKEDIISTLLESDKYHLTHKGVEQVKKAIEELKKKKVKLDAIYCSPFIRAKETAEIVGNHFGIKAKTDKRLSERLHGPMCEGKPERLCEMLVPATPESKHAGGESIMEVKARMSRFLREIDEKHEGKTILVISHGDPLWALTAFTENISEDKIISTRQRLMPGTGELKKINLKNYPYNVEGDLDVHRPFIDGVALKCPKCGGKSVRTPEVCDCWLDSGCMPFAQWHYPFENKNWIDKPSGSDKQYPADFIVEAIDQTRGWFYTLLAVATILGRPAPYKNVGVTGFAMASEGKKLSKSEGAGEGFTKIIEEYSADGLRWYLFTVNDLGDNKTITAQDVQKKFRNFLLILFNTLRFFSLYPIKDKALLINEPEPQGLLDKWLLARLKKTVAEATKLLDSYYPTPATRLIGQFVVEDLSKWWLRLSRQRFQRPESELSHVYVSSYLRYILLEIAKLLSPFIPYFTEHIYRELNHGLKVSVPSIHLLDWPKLAPFEEAEKLALEEMEDVRHYAACGLAQRQIKQIKVRQPLASAKIKREKRFDAELQDILRAELNVKVIEYDPAQAGEAEIDDNITAELRQEGYARELVRNIQEMRKDAKYPLDYKVGAYWETENKELALAIENLRDLIKNDSLLSEINRGNAGAGHFDVEKKFNLAPGVEIWLGLKA
ncbi:MAG: Isoleucine--tRNA ligase [Parcubacteria group bacterium Licking1014_17]|nr:MAG: Isoleucine--tRNA ligase [Parcubacteria group bacterium Licking1014_17]